MQDLKIVCLNQKALSDLDFRDGDTSRTDTLTFRTKTD